MKNLFQYLYILAANMLVALALTACSSDDYLGVTNGEEDKQLPEVTQKLSGPMPASVEIRVIYGHLHGYTSFHENPPIEGTTFLSKNPTFKFTLKDNQWVPDKANPKYLYAFSSGKMFNTESSTPYAIDIHYFNEKGEDITEKMVADGKDKKLQHFFIPENIKPLKDFDKTIDNPNNNEIFRYDYIDPTPFGKTIKKDGAEYNGLKNPMGFKGYITFGYSRHTFNLAIKLMEAKNQKTSNQKELDFFYNDQIGKVEHSPQKIASWLPTSEQEKNDLWYPTINIPVMVYIDWCEEYVGDVKIKDGKLPKLEELSPKTQRLVKTIHDNLHIPYKEILENLHYRLYGDTDPESGSYWF